MTHATPLNRKIDFAVVFAVRNANPNGDPLNSNEPRTFGEEGLGEVTTVAIKRKIRDRLMDAGHPIFVQSDDRRTDDAVSLKARLDATLTTTLPAEQLREAACKTWLDVRAFGQLLAYKGQKVKRGRGQAGEAGAAEGDSGGVSIGIRGPVSVHPALSLEPIQVTSQQITKSVSAEGDGTKRGSDTMGMSHRVNDAIYVFYGAVNPQLAERTGFTFDDAIAIKAVLPKLFENDASAARPEGSMEVLKVIWWEHGSKMGSMSSAKVHRSLVVTPGTGAVEAPELEGVTVEVIDGF